MQIYKCSGHVNSALARNVGLKYATKDYIFFVDGDVELNIQFIAVAMSYFEKGTADIITGQLREIYYTPDYEKEIGQTVDRFFIDKEKEVFYSGGCFIARVSVVHGAGFWNEGMVRNQDIEFTLRISRFGRFLAIPVSMGTHHTLKYTDRAWEFFKKRYPMYFGMIIRKNLTRPKALMFLLSRNRGFVVGLFFSLGLFCCILLSILINLSFSSCLLVLLLLVVLDLTMGALVGKNIINLFVTHYMYTPLILAGLFVNDKCPHSVTNVTRMS
jgi:glycosyltransferase involved in cell wall biosynthesis